LLTNPSFNPPIPFLARQKEEKFSFPQAHGKGYAEGSALLV
jgi:hypothetical protein